MTTETAENSSSAAPTAADAKAAAETPAKLDAKAAADLSEDELLARIYDEAAVDDDEPAADGGGDKQKVAKAAADADDDDEGEPERDAQGRFVSKNPELKADDKAAPEKKASAEETAEKKPDAAKAPAKDTAGKSGVDYSGDQRGWSEEHRAEFAKLAPEAQAFVVARQKEQLGALTKAQMELADLRKSVDPLVTAVREHSEYFDDLSAAFKSTPADIIKSLVKTERGLRYGTFQEKQATLLAMARDYGVPLVLAESDGNPDPSLPTSEHHPLVHDLRQQNARLEARLAAMERQTTTTASAGLERSVAEFAATKDEAGEPKYPDFDVLREDMSQLISLGHAATLHEAYEKAERLHPEILERKAAARKKAEEARDAAAKAKRAGALNVNTSPKAVQRYASVDDMLGDVYDRAVAS